MLLLELLEAEGAPLAALHHADVALRRIRRTEAGEVVDGLQVILVFLLELIELALKLVHPPGVVRVLHVRFPDLAHPRGDRDARFHRLPDGVALLGGLAQIEDILVLRDQVLEGLRTVPRDVQLLFAQAEALQGGAKLLPRHRLEPACHLLADHAHAEQGGRGVLRLDVLAHRAEGQGVVFERDAGDHQLVVLPAQLERQVVRHHVDAAREVHQRLNVRHVLERLRREEVGEGGRGAVVGLLKLFGEGVVHRQRIQRHAVRLFEEDAPGLHAVLEQHHPAGSGYEILAAQKRGDLTGGGVAVLQRLARAEIVILAALFVEFEVLVQLVQPVVQLLREIQIAGAALHLRDQPIRLLIARFELRGDFPAPFAQAEHRQEHPVAERPMQIVLCALAPVVLDQIAQGVDRVVLLESAHEGVLDPAEGLRQRFAAELIQQPAERRILRVHALEQRGAVLVQVGHDEALEVAGGRRAVAGL